MMVHDISQGTPTGGDPNAPTSRQQLTRQEAIKQLTRQEAIKQIEHRRRFWISTTAWAAVMILVTVIWATSEYHNAGGWPTNGFSQSSGIPNVWNNWIIYPAIAGMLGPAIAWVLGTAASAWYTFGRKPISEAKIKHEMKRQAGQR